MIRTSIGALILFIGAVFGTLPALAQDSIVTLGPMAANPDVEAQNQAAPAPPCGTGAITIARMQWPSAAILAAIHARLLKAQFGCSVEVVDGDMAATGSSMGTTGQPAAAPEMWITRIADIWNSGIKGQQLRQAAPTYDVSSFEGWFVPTYVTDAHPEVTSAASLKGLASAGEKLRFISCPIDWGCAVINRNLIKAEGLDGLLDVVEPGNRFEMDTLIAEAVGRKEPFAFYYWQPNAILSQFKFQPLDLGPYDHDALQCLAQQACAAPKPGSFAPEPVVIAVADWVFADIPAVAGYFQRATMPIGEMNALLAELGEPNATVDTVADRFVAERAEIWQKWAGPAAGR
ncbi:MAG TPA: glycine betaine ABC transporter substrate-binding protein [Devosiaceae bacterium]